MTPVGGHQENKMGCWMGLQDSIKSSILGIEKKQANEREREGRPKHDKSKLKNQMVKR